MDTDNQALKISRRDALKLGIGVGAFAAGGYVALNMKKSEENAKLVDRFLPLVTEPSPEELEVFNSIAIEEFERACTEMTHVQAGAIELNGYTYSLVVTDSLRNGTQHRSQTLVIHSGAKEDITLKTKLLVNFHSTDGAGSDIRMLSDNYRRLLKEDMVICIPLTNGAGNGRTVAFPELGGEQEIVLELPTDANTAYKGGALVDNSPGNILRNLSNVFSKLGINHNISAEMIGVSMGGTIGLVNLLFWEKYRTEYGFLPQLQKAGFYAPIHSLFGRENLKEALRSTDLSIGSMVRIIALGSREMYKDLHDINDGVYGDFSFYEAHPEAKHLFRYNLFKSSPYHMLQLARQTNTSLNTQDIYVLSAMMDSIVRPEETKAIVRNLSEAYPDSKIRHQEEMGGHIANGFIFDILDKLREIDTKQPLSNRR